MEKEYQTKDLKAAKSTPKKDGEIFKDGDVLNLSGKAANVAMLLKKTLKKD